MWKNSEAYILSKAYLDDFFKLSDAIKKEGPNDFSPEALGAMKFFLRIAKQREKADSAQSLLKECPEIKNELMKMCSLEADGTPKLVDLANVCSCLDSESFQDIWKYSGNALHELNKFADYLEKNKSKKVVKRPDSYFTSDYQHIVCSSAFRRLQDKTQLFLMDPMDFSRRRLTHSIEVDSFCERIASRVSISNYLGGYNVCDENDSLLVARCAGVLHDIGNPPFGHSSERVISDFFRDENIKRKLFEETGSKFNIYYDDLCVFDGNAQSLRIACKLLPFGKRKGASLSAAVLGSIIKYPYPAWERVGKKKAGYFRSEERVIKMLEALGTYKPGKRNPFAFILELADDLAYLVSDLEDSIHKGHITYDMFMETLGKEDNPQIKAFREKILENTENCEPGCYHKSFEKVTTTYISQFRKAVISSLADRSHNGKPIFKAIIDDGADDSLSIIEHSDHYALYKALNDLKNILFEKCNEIKENEYLAERYIRFLLKEFFDALIDATPNFEKKTFENESSVPCYGRKNKTISYISPNLIESIFDEMASEHIDASGKEAIVYYKMRLIVDEISGMTDSFAYDLYNKFIKRP